MYSLSYWGLFINGPVYQLPQINCWQFLLKVTGKSVLVMSQLSSNVSFDSPSLHV